MNVSLITYDDLPHLDPDDRLLQDELTSRGIPCQALVWNDPSIDWSSAGLCVMRSTWDYHKQVDEFRNWIDRVAGVTTLLNSPDLLRWNIEKTYLRDLSHKELPVIPTHWYGRHNCGDLSAMVAGTGWKEIILKPVVGLATSGVKKIDTTDADDLAEGQAHLEDLLNSHGMVMLQPYLKSVEEHGERAMIFIDGEFSHSVRKAAFQALAVAGEAGETPAEAHQDEIDVATRIISNLSITPLYARVDLVRDESGQPVLLELELVEPSLFLAMSNTATKCLADAIEKRL